MESSGLAMRIYVAGHTGLVGSALTRAIDNSASHTWVGKTRQELDLANRAEVFAFLDIEKPDAVIVAAAKVGEFMPTPHSRSSF